MSQRESSSQDFAAADSLLPVSDIQGLILRGYRHPYIRFFILQIKDFNGARELCSKLQPGSGGPLTITTAENWGPVRPPYCLNVGVTSTGLCKLLDGDNGGCNQPGNFTGPNYSAVDNATGDSLFIPFSYGADFVNQPDGYCATNVGDTGLSDPSNWWQKGGWQLSGSPPTSAVMDLVLSLYTLDPESRETFSCDLLEMIPDDKHGNPALVPAFIHDSDPLLDEAGKPTTVIHFGYRDGLSQPRISGDPTDDPGAGEDDQLFVPAWHFVINAPPSVARSEPAPNYIAHPLLSNGCFAAFRLLYQDVRAFNQFIDQPGEDRDLLAAKMCGRWFDGTPLMVSPDGPDPTLSDLDRTNFAYVTPTAHQKGPRPDSQTELLCPFASHTRRTNPRDDASVELNSNPPGSGITTNGVNQRIRRFATTYGPVYSRTSQIAGEIQRGLIGLFMCADLGNQFEFLMSQWMNTNPTTSNDLSPNSGASVDPLFGPRENTDDDVQNFYYPTQPTSGAAEQFVGYPFPSFAENMARFIRTDGGLYVFLPSITALGWLAKGELPS